MDVPFRLKYVDVPFRLMDVPSFTNPAKGQGREDGPSRPRFLEHGGGHLQDPCFIALTGLPRTLYVFPVIRIRFQKAVFGQGSRLLRNMGRSKGRVVHRGSFLQRLSHLREGLRYGRDG